MSHAHSQVALSRLFSQALIFFQNTMQGAPPFLDTGASCCAEGTHDAPQSSRALRIFPTEILGESFQRNSKVVLRTDCVSLSGAESSFTLLNYSEILSLTSAAYWSIRDL
jgi:hypothetical protein